VNGDVNLSRPTARLLTLSEQRQVLKFRANVFKPCLHKRTRFLGVSGNFLMQLLLILRIIIMLSPVGIYQTSVTLVGLLSFFLMNCYFLKNDHWTDWWSCFSVGFITWDKLSSFYSFFLFLKTV